MGFLKCAFLLLAAAIANTSLAASPEVLKCQLGQASLANLREGDCWVYGNFKSVRANLEELYHTLLFSQQNFYFTKLAYYHRRFLQKSFSLRPIPAPKSKANIDIQSFALSRGVTGEIILEGCLPLAQPEDNQIACLTRSLHVTTSATKGDAVPVGINAILSARGRKNYAQWPPFIIQSANLFVDREDEERTGRAFCEALGFAFARRSSSSIEMGNYSLSIRDTMVDFNIDYSLDQKGLNSRARVAPGENRQINVWDTWSSAPTLEWLRVDKVGVSQKLLLVGVSKVICADTNP